MSELDDMLNAARDVTPSTPLSDLVDDVAQHAPTPRPVNRKSETKSEVVEKTSTDEKPAAKAVERPHIDKYIIAIYLTLCVISVIELYSASSREISAGKVFMPLVRHLIQMFIGLGICFGVAKIPYRWLVPFTPLIALISAGAMIAVLVGGETINGAKRGFTIAGFLILPAELLKLSAVLIIAWITAKCQQKKGGVKNGGVFFSALIVICFGGLLFTQGLTNTLLLMAISLSMMLVGGVQWKKFGIVCLVYALVGAGALFYKMGKEEKDDSKANGRATVEAVNDPLKDASGREATWSKRLIRWGSDSIPKYQQPITAENRQEMYSYMAQANGGFFGVIPGNSRETARLPLAFSDYIYSIVVEDIGFFGGMVLLVIYLSLLARAGIVASRCDKVFPALLIMGMAVMICFQALFHMAIVTGVFPVSGQPLPMISKGGMSIFVTSFAFGIMMSVSRYASEKGKGRSKKKGEDNLPESIDAANPMQIK